MFASLNNKNLIAVRRICRSMHLHHPEFTVKTTGAEFRCCGKVLHDKAWLTFYVKWWYYK